MTNNEEVNYSRSLKDELETLVMYTEHVKSYECARLLLEESSKYSREQSFSFYEQTGDFCVRFWAPVWWGLEPSCAKYKTIK